MMKACGTPLWTRLLTELLADGYKQARHDCAPAFPRLVVEPVTSCAHVLLAPCASLLGLCKCLALGHTALPFGNVPHVHVPHVT